MDSKPKEQDVLFQKLKVLEAEKELLEKHVGVLNGCLSVEELRAKIRTLEKKEELLVQMETIMGKLRLEVEPLKYLNSVLEKKLTAMNQCTTNSIVSGSSEGCKSNSSKSGVSVSEQKLVDKNSDIIKKTKKSKSVVKDDLDDLISLMNQYDMVTYQEILNLDKEKHSETQSVDQEPKTLGMNDNKNDILHNQKAAISTDIEAEDLKEQFENLSQSMISSVSGSINHEETVHNSYNTEFCTPSTSKKNPLNDVDFDNQLSKKTQEKNDLNEEEVSCVFSKNADDVESTIDPFQNLLKNANTTSILKSEKEFVLKELDKFFSGCKKFLSQDPKSVNNANESVNLPEELINSAKLFNKYLNISDQNESCEQAISSKQAESTKLDANIVEKCSFNDMNLKMDILRGLYSFGFNNPTDLQQRVIKSCVEGQDIFVFAESDNNRIISFTVPLLQRINTNTRECQALVLVPNRELAILIKKVIESIGNFMGVEVCIGGDNVPKKLSVIPHVVVGTPTGVFSMIEVNSLCIKYIKTVVINQIDEMLTDNHFFKIEDIMNLCCKDKQTTIMASKRFDEIVAVYSGILSNPLFIIDKNEK